MKSFVYGSSRGTPVNRALVGLALAGTVISSVCASDNVIIRPFGQWAELPAAKQLVVGLVYEESEAYHIWAGTDIKNVTAHANGESYGIDINQGYLALQYGINARWAADLNVGYTSMGWRYFDQGGVQSTSGLMDVSFGVRYQIFHETNSSSAWTPTLTFRAGAVLPGTYDNDFPFAPGLSSAAIAPELIMRKHFGWTGFGAYGDALYRWNKTTGNDQYNISVGLFQQIKGWEIAAGYRHLQTISGSDIVLYDDGSIYYPRDPREIYDAIEAGFSYTTPKRHLRWGFHTRTVVDGSNTDSKFWLGGSLDIPFGPFGKKQAE